MINMASSDSDDSDSDSIIGEPYVIFQILKPTLTLAKNSKQN
jgi:hypothetical protein